MQGFVLFLFSYSFLFAELNLGFYPKQSPSIPETVKQAQDKIFKISVPYSIFLREKDYEGVLSAPNFPENTKKATQDCIDLGLKECRVPFTSMEGTAFLDRNPEYIWTNCHLVAEWMKLASFRQTFQTTREIREFFLETSLPIELFTSEGEKIFEKNEEATLVAFSPAVMDYKPAPFCNGMDDLVKIKLSKKLHAEGLSWSKHNEQETLFMGGFPKQTESRALTQKNDSDGVSFYWTHGAFLAKKSIDFLAYLAKIAHNEFVTSATYTETFLADGVNGMSGSPVLNQNGEVTGIYKGFLTLPENRELEIPYVSLFVSTSGMRFVESVSEL